MAATPEQMEKARATAYQLCLRYMNNGSGYLDKAGSASSVSDLEGKLKDKEKANLSKLKSVKIPSESEYASWDKAAFDKYWTVTFMDALPSFDGKSECRQRVAKKVSAMKVTVAEPAKQADANAEDGTQTGEGEDAADEEKAEAEEGTNADQIVGAAPANPVSADSVISIADEAVNTEKQSKDSGNMVSIIVLAILVLVVVGLVAYALNVMRRNKEEDRNIRRSEERSNARRQEPVSQADPADESAFATYAAPAAPARDSRDAEIAQLKAELERLKHQNSRNAGAYTPGTARKRQPTTIYLARANSEGVFTRADASYNMGNSIFKLVTTDGVSGTYQVIDDPAVFELALMMPTDYLENACSGRNLQLSQGASTIINEAAGTAVFDNGRWRVTRKAQIRYSR